MSTTTVRKMKLLAWYPFVTTTDEERRAARELMDKAIEALTELGFNVEVKFEVTGKQDR